MAAQYEGYRRLNRENAKSRRCDERLSVQKMTKPEMQKKSCTPYPPAENLNGKSWK